MDFYKKTRLFLRVEGIVINDYYGKIHLDSYILKRKTLINLRNNNFLEGFLTQ